MRAFCTGMQFPKGGPPLHYRSVKHRVGTLGEIPCFVQSQSWSRRGYLRGTLFMVAGRSIRLGLSGRVPRAALEKMHQAHG